MSAQRAFGDGVHTMLARMLDNGTLIIDDFYGPLETKPQQHGYFFLDKQCITFKLSSSVKRAPLNLPAAWHQMFISTPYGKQIAGFPKSVIGMDFAKIEERIIGKKYNQLIIDDLYDKPVPPKPSRRPYYDAHIKKRNWK